MLSSKNRLRGRKIIDDIFKKGRYLSNKYLSAKISPNDLTFSRFAVSIGLNFSKKAVERNKFRRIIMALVKENINRIKTGHDVVFFVSKKIILDSKEIKPFFEEFLRKNNLLKK